MKPVVAKKKRPGHSDRPVPEKKKPVKKLQAPSQSRSNGECVIGIDISTYSIAGACIAFDRILNKELQPGFHTVRWTRNDDWFKRLADASKAGDFIHDLIVSMKGPMYAPDEIHVAIEEPFPVGRKLMGESKTLKQQAQISGAFLGGLLRYGYQHVYEIQAWEWKQVIAEDLGITIHFSKYGKGREGKFRSLEWAMDYYPYEIPRWPDLVENSKLGLIPRPENSKAAGVQPDDRYDALAMCEWMRRQREEFHLSAGTP